MENRYTKDFPVPPSLCDISGRLSVPELFALFMDIAAEHAEALGCGIRALGEKGLFWLTVRTRVRIARLPAMLERVSLTTWPEAPGRLRAERDYLLEKDGELLAAGKTEWAVLDRATGRLTSPRDVYAPETAFCPDTVWTEPFTRAGDEPLEEYARYTVRSVDMDLGQHMNNVAYVRALAGTFGWADWQSLELRELEIAYRTSCHEGDTLIWQRKTRPDGVIALRAGLADGQTAVLAQLVPGVKG